MEEEAGSDAEDADDDDENCLFSDDDFIDKSRPLSMFHER